MPLFPEHAPRRRLLDVAELLGEQVVKLDKAQSNVTPDEYRKSQQERAAQSKAYAGQQRKLHPTQPPARKPEPPGWMDTAVKLPSKLADVAGNFVPESIKSATIPSWILPGPPGMKVGDVTRGMIDIASPLDTSKDATATSQIVHAIASGIPLSKLVGKYGQKAIDAAFAAGKDLIKKFDVASTKALRKALIKPPPKPPTPQELLGGKKPFYSDPKRAAEAAAKGSNDLLGILPEAGQAAAGAAAGAARPALTRGLLSRAIGALSSPFGGFAGGAGALGLQYLLQGGGLKNISDAAFLGANIANRPPDLPKERPGTAMPPASGAEKPTQQKPGLQDQLREAEKQQLDPRHGGPKGLDAQGLPEFQPVKPKPEDVAKVPGVGAQHAIANDRAFLEMRAEYAKLRDKARILQERRLPLGAGMSRFEIDRWRMFNKPEYQTSSGKSIFDVEASPDARP